MINNLREQSKVMIDNSKKINEDQGEEEIQHAAQPERTRHGHVVAGFTSAKTIHQTPYGKGQNQEKKEHSEKKQKSPPKRERLYRSFVDIEIPPEIDPQHNGKKND